MPQRRIVSWLFAGLLTGCTLTSLDDVDSGSGFGATPGGVQDLSLARALVQEGRVPPPESLLVEAMFSEHDLPLEGPPCQTLLCPRAAMGIAPNADEAPAAWLQVGLSSTIDPATFERPSISLVAAVDVSGSMGWQSGSGTPGELSRQLLQAIAGELEATDRFAMVTYGSTVETKLGWVSGDSTDIDAAIMGLTENGSTNMEAGLLRAYEVAASASGTDDVRVMLFTDIQPNVGATTPTEFQSMAAAGAEQGVGLTVFGLGLGMGSELLEAMSSLRGGNAFSLTAPADVPNLMQDQWPWLVSPIAYDLNVSVQPSANLSVTAAYGFPGETTSFDVATVFLSRRKGALLFELAPLGALEGSASMQVSYVDPNGEPFSLALSTSYDGTPLDERGIYMPQLGIEKAVALALLVEGMHEAAKLYDDESRDAAIDRLDRALTRFQADTVAAGDAALEAEAVFWPKLLELMKAGAPMGNLYGQ